MSSATDLILETLMEERANRTGRDVRAGERVDVRVVSRGVLVEAGRRIEQGESTLTGVHVSDLPALQSQLETASPDQMKAAQTRLAAMNEVAKKDRTKYGSSPTIEMAFRDMFNRDIKPLSVCEVVRSKRA
jgi:mRNA-degrading endonuclease toxin of MazEF toxin-antitoxin module